MSALTRLSLVGCVLSTSACADILGLGDFSFGDGGSSSTGTTVGGSNGDGGSGAGTTDGGAGAGGTPVVVGGGGTGGSGGSVNICDSIGSYRDLVLCDGPLLYLRFEEDDVTGTMFNEVASGVGDGTYGATTTSVDGVAAIGGRAARVGNSRCEVPGQGEDLGFEPLEPFTVEAWVQADDSPDPFTFGFIGTWDGSQGYSLFAFPGSSGAGELPNAELKRNALPDAIQCASDPECQAALSFASYRHLVGTYDSDMLASLYLDGELMVSGTLANELITSQVPFAIVGPQDGSSQTVTFDEVAVYGRALTATEVKGHFDCGSGQGCENTD